MTVLTPGVQPVDFVTMADETTWKKTPHRSVRLEQDLWDRLEPAAKTAGLDRSSLIRQFVRWYLREPGANLPQRPD